MNNALDNLNWLMIGNPENRRVAFFKEGLKNNRQHALKILSYELLLQNYDSIFEILDQAITEDTILRIESPGENSKVDNFLITIGLQRSKTKNSIYFLNTSHGIIINSNLWFLGYKVFLTQIRNCIEQIKSNKKLKIEFQNPPEDIALFFDKASCHNYLQTQGVNVPFSLPKCKSYHELIYHMDDLNLQRVFIKPCAGSSSSGVIAYQRNRKLSKELMITSIDRNNDCGQIKFFNSLKVKRYSETAIIKEIIEFILNQYAHIEKWLPKSHYQGKPFDIRVITIGGKVTHMIGRSSKYPMTNLHLGGQRVKINELNLKEDELSVLINEAEKVALAFSNSLYLGIDIILNQNNKKPFIAEVNAFGDLLPNVLNETGDTYTCEIKETLNIWQNHVSHI